MPSPILVIYIPISGLWVNLSCNQVQPRQVNALVPPTRCKKLFSRMVEWAVRRYKLAQALLVVKIKQLGLTGQTGSTKTAPLRLLVR